MEESRTARYRKRSVELHATVIGRALWQRIRSHRRTVENAIEARRQGPYETSYDVAHGYCADRAIIQP